MNIVLTGPMGVGKTAVGEHVARELGRKFVDTDGMIERRSGCTIRELFSKMGEEHFRELEKKVVLDVSKKDGLVIATGGGVVLCPENMRRLRMNGVIIALDAPLDELLERLKKMTGRPLFAAMRKDRKALKRYIDVRSEDYSNSDFTIDTGRMTLQDVVKRVCAITMRRFVRICGCISGKNAEKDIRSAVKSGVSMLELRLDLIPKPDIEGLVRMCPVPVIATDRKSKERLKAAIKAGCGFVDIETVSPQKDEIIRLARRKGCKVIASFHDFDAVPKKFPRKGKADLLKIAVKVRSKDDLRRLIGLHDGREDIIIVGMGALGQRLRVLAPLLGSYLTYCYIGKRTAPGQLDLKTMKKHYMELGLR
jgi:shikimate kinase